MQLNINKNLSLTSKCKALHFDIQQTDGAAKDFRRGDSVEAHVTLDCAAAATNPGQFDSRAYYRALGYGFYVKKPDVTAVRHENNIVIDALEALKARLKSVYGKCCEYADAGVYEAIVLGDKSDMDGSLRGLFSPLASGTFLQYRGFTSHLSGWGSISS